MNQYNNQEVEKKWVKKWQEIGLYRAEDGGKKKKSYLLIEFPYPSGERLHVGHARSYSCLDAVARKRRMQGENVLFPIGWDAFGLPAENYAIKTGIHPTITTAQNIANSRAQAMSWGLSFDWTREINTTDPEYYKWTQWIFLQLYKKGLAYKSEIAVNWCPSCKINLANEEVVEGNCERCGSKTDRRRQNQWLLRITAYADRLLKDLDTVNYRSDIKLQQVNWIGKKEGINITYDIEGLNNKVTVFTTRPDTNFGATFVVLSPENDLALKIVTDEQKKAVNEYVSQAKNKSDLERLAEGRKKTGVFTGRYAINQLNGYKMPIWIGDFVLSHVGTGALVGVPAHDKRDFEFAREFNIPVVRVVVGKDNDTSPINNIDQVQEEEGIMVNSGFLDGLDIHQATPKMMDYLIEKGWGEKTSSYHLRDWVFSRQHYWGEPIPMINCQKCGWQPVPEDQLPVKLPEVEKYLPSETGESPLATISDWVNTSCPNCQGQAKRETDTMPNWAGSSWYFLRYIDPHNKQALADSDKLKYWLPVDWYNGGMEHTTLHLLYSRFWHKFLYDQGLVPTIEPYAKRTSHGVVLGPDGKRMSKSKGNVINPDDIVRKFGADTLRLYEMFMGPFEQTVAWSDTAVEGVHRFLKRVWVLAQKETESEISKVAMYKLSRLVAKVDSDLENTKFNTTISSCMEFVNWWQANPGQLGKSGLKEYLKIMAPMAPFITEELWSLAGGDESIHTQSWPVINSEETVEKIIFVVQVNGKVREKFEVTSEEASEENIKHLALESAKVQNYLKGASYRTIFVPNKLINFIIS